jgi:hypothetical protein
VWPPPQGGGGAWRDLLRSALNDFRSLLEGEDTTLSAFDLQSNCLVQALHHLLYLIGKTGRLPAGNSTRQPTAAPVPGVIYWLGTNGETVPDWLNAVQVT